MRMEHYCGDCWELRQELVMCKNFWAFIKHVWRVHFWGMKTGGEMSEDALNLKPSTIALIRRDARISELESDNAALRERVTRLQGELRTQWQSRDALATRCRELEGALKRVYTMATSQLAEPVDEDTGTLVGIATIVEELELRDAAMKGAKP